MKIPTGWLRDKIALLVRILDKSLVSTLVLDQPTDSLHVTLLSNEIGAYADWQIFLSRLVIGIYIKKQSHDTLRRRLKCYHKMKQSLRRQVGRSSK